jgi:hypothetical protein
MELQAVCASGSASGKVATSTVLKPGAQAQAARRTGEQCLMDLTGSVRGQVFRISYDDAAARDRIH